MSNENNQERQIDHHENNEGHIFSLDRWDTVIQNSASPALPSLQSNNFEPTVRKIFIHFNVLHLNNFLQHSFSLTEEEHTLLPY